MLDRFITSFIFQQSRPTTDDFSIISGYNEYKYYIDLNLVLLLDLTGSDTIFHCELSVKAKRCMLWDETLIKILADVINSFENILTELLQEK